MYLAAQLPSPTQPSVTWGTYPNLILLSGTGLGAPMCPPMAHSDRELLGAAVMQEGKKVIPVAVSSCVSFGGFLHFDTLLYAI